MRTGPWSVPTIPLVVHDLRCQITPLSAKGMELHGVLRRGLGGLCHCDKARGDAPDAPGEPGWAMKFPAVAVDVDHPAGHLRYVFERCGHCFLRASRPRSRIRN